MDETISNPNKILKFDLTNSTLDDFGKYIFGLLANKYEILEDDFFSIVKYMSFYFNNETWVWNCLIK